MEVILMERVEKLGQMGDVVSVKNGYARNFLLPRNKALRATKENMASFENQRNELETRNLERKQEAEAVSQKMTDVKITLIRQAGETGQLYGSVSARDVAAELTETGFKTEHSQVVMERPIKLLGLHDIRVVLHPEVSLTVEANVARSSEEAELQAQGISLTDDDKFEEEEVDLAAEAEEIFEKPAADDDSDGEAGDEAGDSAAGEAEAEAGDEQPRT